MLSGVAGRTRILMVEDQEPSPWGRDGVREGVKGGTSERGKTKSILGMGGRVSGVFVFVSSSGSVGG